MSSRPALLRGVASAATVAATTLAATALVFTASGALASAGPRHSSLSMVPARTALVYSSHGVRVSTPNAAEPRTALSEVKLFIVDYALRHGDGSAQDEELAEQMITASNDADASELDDKYPEAIDAVADEYGLTATSRGSFWGDSFTSAADLVTFLDGLRSAHPDSPLLGWMADVDPVAADGTVQDWGTSHLPGVIGTKFGWADDSSTAVASASIGDDFTVAAITYAGPEEQSEDVGDALGSVDLVFLHSPAVDRVLRMP